MLSSKLFWGTGGLPLNIVVENRGVLEVKTFEIHWYKSNDLLLLFSYLISY